MGRKTVLVDDFDGKDLPEDTKPVALSLGRTTYSLYLSDKNHGKLLEVLQPFIENAETASSSTRTTAATTSSTDKDRLKKVREWAQTTGYKYKNAAGEEVTLGDRGRIPDEVMKAYDEAN